MTFITSTTEGGWMLFSPPVCLSVYSLQNRRFFKYIGQSILLFCLSPPGHNSKPIVKLYQVVEVVSTEKTIDFEVKGQIAKIVIFHPIDLKIKPQLHRASLKWETIFEIKRLKVNSRSNF